MVIHSILYLLCCDRKVLEFHTEGIFLKLDFKMILYNNRSTADIIFRLRGSAFANGKMWLLVGALSNLKWFGWPKWALKIVSAGQVLFNVLESIYFVKKGAPEFEGKDYLSILGKVLVFLLVFRSKLAFDRFWSGRVAIGDITGSALKIVSDASVFLDADTEEQVNSDHFPPGKQRDSHFVPLNCNRLHRWRHGKKSTGWLWRQASQ